MLAFLVHHYRSVKGPWAKSISASYALLGMSLMVNSVLRILDGTYISVITGGIATKVLFGVTLMFLFLRIYQEKDAE